MVGFILMIDPFTSENGATRFVPCSQYWPEVPSDRLTDTRSFFPRRNCCSWRGWFSDYLQRSDMARSFRLRTLMKQRRSIQG